LKEIIIF